MDIENKRALALELFATRTPLSEDPFPQETGVLLSDRIEYFVQNGDLIYPFRKDRLKPAGYELTIGSEFYLGGYKYSFDEPEAPEYIEVRPFDVTVIKTNEILCLPRFVIARWNLRVDWAYKGLLWIGAAQVDPGYVGNLFCPIYNLSDKPIRLRRGERIALIDFVKTTQFVEGQSIEYPLPSARRRNIIEDYGCDDLRSGLVKGAAERIDDAEEKIKDIDSRVSWFSTVVVTVISVAVTVALSIRITDIQGRFDFLGVWFVAFAALFGLLASILNTSGWVRAATGKLFEKYPYRNSYDSVRVRTVRSWIGWMFLLSFSCMVSSVVGFVIIREAYGTADVDLLSKRIERLERTVTEQY